MRSIVYSITFNDQLNTLLDMGAPKFGAAVVDEKNRRVYATIANILAHTPAIKARDPVLGLVVYPITKTPFIVVYDYDEAELRMHFIFQKGKSLDDLDPASVVW